MFCFFFVGCTQTKIIDGIKYKPYGLFNENTTRNEKIHYEMSVGNLILGIVLIETVIVPIYIFGFDLFEPIGLEDGHIKGAVIE